MRQRGEYHPDTDKTRRLSHSFLGVRMENKWFLKVRIRHYWSTCDRDDKSPQGRLMNVSPIHQVFSRQLSIVTAVLRRFVPPNFLWRATRYLHQIIDRLDDSRKVLNISPVIVQETHKSAHFTNCLLILDGSNF